MRKFHFPFFTPLPFFLVFALQVNGQTRPSSHSNKAATDSLSADTTDSNKSLLIEFDFGSNRGYQIKRKTAGADTSQRYISPSINYEANSGFYASLGFYKTPGAKKRWDEIYFGLGYDFTISKSADVDGSFGYTRYTYNEAIKQNGVNPSGNDVDVYIKHDFSIVAIKITGDYYFGGTNSDVDLITDIDHAFYIEHILSKKDELAIDPTVSIVGATLNYYKGNVKIPQLPSNAPKKQKEALQEAQAAFNDFSKFRFAYYDFYVPINYAIGKFDFELAWHYTVPMNMPDILDAKSYSYITALVSFDFLKSKGK